MFYTIVGAGAVGAGAASCYGSGSDQKMRLRLRNTAFTVFRIRKDPHHLAGSRIFDADPDPRLQNWHLINLFSVEKYRSVNIFKYIYANFSVHISLIGHF
jgi:hypothetical protein